jgi:hypothetical protein
MMLIVLVVIPHGVDSDRSLVGSCVMLDLERTREDMSFYVHAVSGLVKDARKNSRGSGTKNSINQVVPLVLSGAQRENVKFCGQWSKCCKGSNERRLKKKRCFPPSENFSILTSG